eukprot:322229_1
MKRKRSIASQLDDLQLEQGTTPLTSHCNDKCDDSDSFNEPLQKRAKKSPTELSCPVCGRSFTRPGAMATHQNACVRKQKLQNDMKQKKRRSSSFFTSYFKPKVSADDKSSASSSQQLRQQPSSTGDKSYAPLPSSPHKAVASSPSPPSAAHKADAPVTAPNTKPSNSRQNSLMSTATASVKRRIALVNDSNEIIEWIEAPNIYLPKCRGCIPTAITDETKCNAEDITCFLELIPIPKITKHTTWWVSQTGIHHSSCVGVITKSTTAEQCNDRCHNLRDNPALRELIEISFKTGEGARNCDMNGQSLRAKLDERKNKIDTLTSKVQYVERTNHNKLVKTDLYKRMTTQIALCDDPSVVRIFRSYLKHQNDKHLFRKIQMFVDGHYSPNNYVDEDVYKTMLITLIGGPMLSDMMKLSGTCMSKQAAKDRFKLMKGETNGFITRVEDFTAKNIEEHIKNTISRRMISPVAVLNFKADEIHVVQRFIQNLWTFAQCLKHSGSKRKSQECIM